MNINHHVSDVLLTRYATGGLGEAWSLAVATHAALCSHINTLERECVDGTGWCAKAQKNAMLAHDNMRAWPGRAQAHASRHSD